MKITELILKNFGKFTNKQILLADGINIIYGENESGKTTLGRIQTFMRESCGLPAVTGDFAWTGISIGMRKAAL